MKKHVLIIMMLVISTQLKSQVQPRSFMTTTDHLIGLPNPVLNAIPFGAPATKAFNAAYRTDGSLWFYVIDRKLFDVNGNMIYELFTVSDPCTGVGLVANGVDKSTEIPVIPVPDIITEFNEKVINEIYLNSFASGRHKLSSTELGDAMMVAMQCIYDGGPAVAAARALVHSQYPFTMFNDEELCTGSAYRKMAANPDSKAINQSAVFLFPNPVKDKLTIGFNEKVTSHIQVLDIAGRVLMEVKLPEGSYSVTMDVSKLSAGSYLYCIAGTGISGKFEVVK